MVAGYRGRLLKLSANVTKRDNVNRRKLGGVGLRSMGSGIALVWALVVLAGCSPGPSAAPEAIRIAISDRVQDGTVDMRQLPTRLTFDDPSAFQYLNGGWYPPRKLSRPDEAESHFVWSRGSASVVEMQLAMLGDLTVIINGEQVRGGKMLPAQSVSILWNDQPLGTLVEHKGNLLPLRFTVPASVQQLGLNRLVLLPNNWVDSSMSAQAEHQTSRALRVDSIEITGNLAARPRGDSAPASARGADFVQRLGTVVSYYEVLPKAARLTGSFAAGVSGARGRIVVSVDGGPSQTLFDSATSTPLETDPIPERKPATRGFDVDLSKFAGRAVGLSFVVNGAAGGADATWSAPVLSGELPGTGAKPSPGSGGAVADSASPNFVIVLFDTMRADATEPYGAAVGSSPSIAKLGREGTVFRNAFSTAASTRVSVASLLTGLYPPRHETIQIASKLPTYVDYLPELLAERDYTTVGVVNNPQVAKQWGFARGFDAYEELFRIGESQLRAEHPDPRERARWTWETHIAPTISERGKQPFFVYLHELDPHFPYEPLPPYDSPEDDGYRGAPLTMPRTMNKYAGFAQILRYLLAVNDHRPWLDAASLDRLLLRYAGEVKYMDAYLGSILDMLDDSDQRRSTVVVFLSDHGEEFLEHGRWGHGAQLYDPAVRVPLIISRPHRSDNGAVVDRPVELIDVVPTVLGLAGIDVPNAIQGRDLFADSRQDAEAATSRAAFAYGDWVYRSALNGEKFSSRQVSVRRGDDKLIRTQHPSGLGMFYTYELYDLARDPTETINLWFSRPVLGHGLRLRLAAQDLSDANAKISDRKEAEAVDPEMLNRLRALGYSD